MNITHVNILVIGLSISSFTLIYLTCFQKEDFVYGYWLSCTFTVSMFFLFLVSVAFVYHCHPGTQLHLYWSYLSTKDLKQSCTDLVPVYFSFS